MIEINRIMAGATIAVLREARKLGINDMGLL